MLSFFKTDSNLPFNYLITETSGPVSLDPLDADGTQNLPVARMIYATPLEVDANGFLKSNVLESFSYDVTTRILSWQSMSGVTFTDGTIIEPMDIAFAVARMAYTRPHFPVIENIQGVQEWVKQHDALATLPEGIRVEGTNIEIQFAKEVDHPLFRFSLEIFSIIPKKCVDIATNKVICEKIPGSGYYEIIRRDNNKIHFELRGSEIHGEPAPKSIIFQYKIPSEVFGNQLIKEDQTVIQGNEIKLNLSQLEVLKQNYQTTFLPSARIGLILLNPNHGAFKMRQCRQIFIQIYRNIFEKIIGSGGTLESSVFTDVLPGYMKSQELAQKEFSKISDIDRQSCLAALKAVPIQWAKNQEDKNSIYSIVMDEVTSQLQIPISKTVMFNTRKEELDAFTNGDIGVLFASTGFWAIDPAGDIQMLLTPNMHKLLQFVSQDDIAQGLIKNLKTSAENNSEAFKTLNQYLHDKALFNVYTHIRRFYTSPHKNIVAELPISITSPAPWQVFRMK